MLGLSALFAPLSARAQAAVDPTPIQFSDNAEEARFHALVSELRCVMCQNQSLADSNAQIAVDLRHEVLALMRQGKSNAEIKDFLVARYGEFVLYRPQVESKTWLLWFGPAVVLLAGGLVVAGIVRRRSTQQRGKTHAGDATRGAAANAAEDDQEW
ncbi:cytochrome c-type biogenesis protein [Lysobacter olei]